jgi:UDP-2,3-diacylglucosamine pyrophosphatase LpxH
MKIQIMNDLHLEFDNQGPVLALPGGEILLLAGDVAVAAYLGKQRTDKLAKKHERVAREFFFHQCAKYERVYYIMGNHEHYNGIFDYTVETMREFLEGTNVTILDNEWVDLDHNCGWQLFGGTLWTDYNNQDWFAMHAAKDKMNDHHIIKKLKPVANPYGEFMGRFLPVDAYEEHNKTLEALENGIYDMHRIDRPTIVMTHHAPTHQSIMPQYKGDLLNAAYASDLSEQIMRLSNIKYWFHGHMHDSIEYTVGECQVKCNPRGYNYYALNPNFKQHFELEI